MALIWIGFLELENKKETKKNNQNQKKTKKKKLREDEGDLCLVGIVRVDWFVDLTFFFVSFYLYLFSFSSL